MSEAFAAMLAQIAGGVWDRYRYTPDREEFVQDAVLLLLTPSRTGRPPLDRLDPDRPGGQLFNFISTCVINHGKKLRYKADKAAATAAHVAELAKAGRLGEAQDLAALPPTLRKAARLHADGDQAGARAAARAAAKLGAAASDDQVIQALTPVPQE